ncbi:dolichyl-diphosphooligosaccharide--protein glycosyltransferase subunit 1B [Nymphaea colorata]|nr:dolichyl-diphosphooligosaccharide--protein glycosyltransferase subunit 1B [Nymphaea colorata]
MVGAMVKEAAGRIVPLIFLLLALRLAASSPADLVILKAERRIDLTSPIVRASVSLKVQNSGALPSSDVLIAFPSTQIKRLSLLNVVAVEGKRKKKSFKPLTVNPTKLSDIPEDVHLFSISLPNSLNSGETISLELLFILTHSLEPFPVEISQSESQFVHYDDSAVLLSPYLVKEQVTHIKTPNNKIESYTRINPVNVVGSELKYGTYSDRLPFSSDLIRVHFENNHPFAVVEEFTREVEISHWGSIQVTEHYSLAHAGARHMGVFSRLDYQSKPSFNGISSFRHLLARLPPRVHSVYYRDEIGNISSSHLRGDRLKSELEIEPRYPLFGGWKATFIIGYGLPLQDFLFESTDGKRYLNFSLGCPLVETTVDKLTVKVVLPEGSTDPYAVTPFAVAQRQEKSYSYLDVVGRTVIVLEKHNVVPEHNVPFQVYYKFNSVFMLAEPFMLAVAFFLFFVACIAYQHIDLSISKS